jgi:hypothetical protein
LILDSCCGWGRILSNAIAAGYTAIGVDIVDRRHEPLSHNGFDFVRADFLSSPPPISAAHSAALNPPYAGNFIKKFVERTLPSSEEVFDDDVPF